MGMWMDRENGMEINLVIENEIEQVFGNGMGWVLGVEMDRSLEVRWIRNRRSEAAMRSSKTLFCKMQMKTVENCDFRIRIRIASNEIRSLASTV